MKRNFIDSHQELRVYQQAFEAAMQIFEQAPALPEDEKEVLKRPLLYSSRLVCTYIAQSWGRRIHKEAFVSQLCRAKANAAETQVWIEFAILCSYWDTQPGQELFQLYHQIKLGIDRLIHYADGWTS